MNLYAYCSNNPVMYVDPSGYNAQSKCPEPGEPEGQKKETDGISANGGKPLSEMSNAELKVLGYKRHSDGSIRDSKGHFAGNSGIIPGTPGVDAVERYLSGNNYMVNGREISVRSADGTLRRYDIVATSPDGTVIGVEVKSGSATRTSQQIAIDNELNNSGGLNTVGQRASDANVSRISGTQVIQVDENGNVTLK